ncbi:helix-turn-helix transcriptional regulator [Streptomyces sp. NPDC051840]|uniref:helix-turn-helix domain-containing protein n=1 Tax=unclassified Streptomyces TaxID=2593676 RepID=UPI003449C860
MRPTKRRSRNASAMKLIGKLVGLFRVTADLTQAQLADRAAVQLETIASIEQGRRALLPDLARRLDQLLDTKGALGTAVDNMPEVDLIPAWAETFIDLEREASTLSFYENQVLPGLLQTESYARAVFSSRVPAFSEEEIEAQTTTRLGRQGILRSHVPPCISFIVAEAVLLDRLGGDDVHKQALEHLRTCSALPGVTIQVMPVGRHSHAALDGPFVLLETADHQHLGYTETQRGSQLIADPDEVSILSQKYAMLRTQALNTEDTRALLDRLLGEQ